MFKYTIFFILMYSFGANSQTSKNHNHLGILKDGFYRANISCINENIFDTNNTKRAIWVEIENDIVIYVGRKKAKSPLNLLDRNQSRVISIPYLKKKNGKIFAEYSLSTEVIEGDTNSSRNKNCKIEIIQDKTTNNNSYK